MKRLFRSLFGSQPASRIITQRRRPALETLENRLVPAIVDLTTHGSAGVINGAIFQQTDAQPTGTGVIDSFVRVQAANSKATTEQGHNTDARPLLFDENKSPQFTRSLRLGEVPIVLIDGVAYREFLLDINQSSKASLLSLDQLRLYVGGAPNLTGYNPTTKKLAGLTAVYDLDPGLENNWVKMDYRLNSGSGSGDVLFYVPNQVFASAGPNSYLYLFSRFGDNYAANAGFEEWAVIPSHNNPNASSLSGHVYLDADDDGVFDAGEAPISGVQVTLTGTDDRGVAVSSTTVTGDDGRYTFASLRAGTYEIKETQPASFDDGKDTIGTPGGSTDNDRFFNIVLGAGISGENNNFGEREQVTPEPSSISGFVYLDINNDGVFDTDELAIERVEVTLTGRDDRDNFVSITTYTDADGFYAFTDLRPGTYEITESQPTGFDDGKDTIGTPGGSTDNDRFFAIVLGAGVDGQDNNFGEVDRPPSSLSGYVFIDANMDGKVDLTEQVFINYKITLTGIDILGQQVTMTAYTDESGFYSFTGLRAGTYTLTEEQPAGFDDGPDYIGSQLGTTFHDPDTGEDKLFITLGAGVDGVNNNFTEIRTSPPDPG